MKTKTQPYYDRAHFNPNEKPVGDEMSLPALIAWMLGIGSFIGWIFYQFAVSV